MAKAKLEKVLEYLINKDEDAARDLLHQFIVEKAREIHEECLQEDDTFTDEGDVEENEMSGEEDVDEDLDLEEYFEEGDLDEAGEDDPVDDDDATADLAGDLGADFAGDDVDDDVGDDSDFGDEGGDEQDLEDAIKELQQEFERLQAEVSDLKDEDSDMGGEDDLEPADVADVDDVEAGDMEEPPVAAESETDEEDEDVTEEDEDFFEELDGLLGEDFDDLSEAIVDELEPVKRDPRKDQYIGADQRDWKAASKASTFAPKDFESRHKARPYEIKSSTHTGYDMERAPNVKKGDAQRYKNSMRGSHESLDRVTPDKYRGSHLANAEGADPLAFDKKANKGDGNKTSKFKNFTDDGREPKVVRESASKKNASKRTGAAPKSKSNRRTK